MSLSKEELAELEAVDADLAALELEADNEALASEEANNAALEAAQKASQAEVAAFEEKSAKEAAQVKELALPEATPAPIDDKYAGLRGKTAEWITKNHNKTETKAIANRLGVSDKGKEIDIAKRIVEALSK